MINLLSSEQKKLLRSDYRQRVLVVSGFLFSFLLLIAIGILATLYLSVDTNYKQTKDALAKEQAKNIIMAANKLEKEIKSFSQKLSLLTKSSTSTPVTEVIKSVLNRKVSGVALDDIQYDKSSDNLAVLKISGVAQTRSQLLAFVEVLRSDPNFKKVDSPVSNLIKERQAEFTLNLEINDKQ
jgi:hypothetical protein